FFSINFVMLLIQPGQSLAILLVALFVYAAVFQLFLGGIGNVAANSLLAAVPASVYSSALSLQNMPAYAVVSAYSFLLVGEGGALSLRATFVTLSSVSLILLVAVEARRAAGIKE